MTFFEAAIEVLRQAGRPLHYKKIAEFAIRDDLLSHTGKTPDQTMAQRLTQEIKSQGESVIIETRPGVYSLRESDLARINEEAEQRQKREEARRARREAARAQEIEGEIDEEGAEASGASEDEPPRRRRNRRRSKRSSSAGSSRRRSSSASSASKTSKASKGEDASEDASSSTKTSRRSKSSRRRSSRRRGGRGGAVVSEVNGNIILPDEEAVPDDVLDASVNGNLVSGPNYGGGGRLRARGARRTQRVRSRSSAGASSVSREPRESAASEPSAPAQDSAAQPEQRADTSSRDSRGSRGSRRRKRRSRGGRSSQSQSASKSQSRALERSSSAPQATLSSTRHLKSGPVRLDGIAQAAYTVLQDGQGRYYEITELADEIFERKLVKFHTHDAAATVQAALANDNQIRQKRGHRPLFSQNGAASWGLSEWGLPAASVQKEQTILSLSEEIRQATLGDLGEALLGVKNEALEHIALTLLERLSYQNIKVSKRSSSGDVYFTADWRQGLSDVRVCIQVTLEAADELGAEAVTAIRETLHHYSAAEGVIIHLGEITRDAIQESRQEGKAPITLIDRKTFVELLIRHGLGVQSYTTPILMVDTAFIETLKS